MEELQLGTVGADPARRVGGALLAHSGGVSPHDSGRFTQKTCPLTHLHRFKETLKCLFYGFHM